MHWTSYLSTEVRNRLYNCKTIKSDLKELVDAKWRAYIESGKNINGYTKEDALVSVLELLDCNSCYFDLDREEYDELRRE